MVRQVFSMIADIAYVAGRKSHFTYQPVMPIRERKGRKMSHQKSLKLIIAVILVLSFLVGCGGSTPDPVSEAPASTPTPKPPTPTPKSLNKILFVIEADAVAMAGFTLKKMWDYPTARKLIGEGAYDVVVLQEDIPETLVDTFHEYARKFNAEIKEAGAEPVLFMAWSYERLGRTTMEEIDQAHRDIATELGIEVAPVGLAWQRAMEERPGLDMYDLDREHPSIYGTYLAINVVYATVFGESPIGLAYLPSESGGVTEEEAAFLQRIAWETVQEYHAR
jgi:hypothetical protein